MRRTTVVLGIALSLVACGDKDPGADDAGDDAVTDAPSGPPDARADADLRDAGPSSSRYTARPLGSTTAPSGFYEYLPVGYGDGQDRPLLVFLHGRDEGGNQTDELDRVNNTGLPKLIADDDWPVERPFVVLAPQHTRDTDDCFLADEIHDLLAWAVDNYDVDLKRIYLTGLSCGGIGTWRYLGEYLEEYVAAAVPICGNGVGQWNARGCELGAIAIWALHGDNDNVVGFDGSRIPMEGLAECPSPPRRDAVFTPIVGGSHFIWQPIYDGSAGHDIYAWMLANAKP
jgi:poly(3-hydroxybutyrate) depolymerase